MHDCHKAAGASVPTLQAIVFDVDGTLADTEVLHREAFNAAFAELGLDWHWDEATYRRWLRVAGGRERMRAYARHLAAEGGTPAPDERMLAAVHRRKTERYRERLASGAAALRPGVLRLIDEALSCGVVLGIATAGGLENLGLLLDPLLGADWRHRFAAIATAETAEENKPAPALYRHVLTALDVDPARSVAIEDSHAGCLAARRAGLVPVVTVTGLTRDHDFTGAALVVDHLGEPQRPATVLHGPPLPRGLVDVGWLERLVAARVEPV